MARRRPRQVRRDAAGEHAVVVRDDLPLFDPDMFDHPRLLDRANAWAAQVAPGEPALGWLAYTKTAEYAEAVDDIRARLRQYHERF